jgi:hypothetical protein
MAARLKLLDRLPVSGDILRGSLLMRTIRNHATGCTKCASGEGHRLSVLTVSYPGGRTRQFSLRPERIARGASLARQLPEARRLADSDLLIGAIDTHQARLGCTPRLVAADTAFYSAKNKKAAKAKGVKRVCIPNRSTKSLSRKREQKKRWFREGQKWRTGCEGRISVTKRRHGLNRCRYKGDAGMRRWVGLGIIADNLINIGRALHKQAEQAAP